MVASRLCLWQLEYKLHCCGHYHEARSRHVEKISRLKHGLLTAPADSSSPLVQIHCIGMVNHHPEREKLGLHCHCFRPGSKSPKADDSR